MEIKACKECKRYQVVCEGETSVYFCPKDKETRERDVGTGEKMQYFATNYALKIIFAIMILFGLYAIANTFILGFLVGMGP